MEQNPGAATVPGQNRWPAGGGTGGCDRNTRANGKAAGMTQIGRTAPPGSVHGLVPALTSFVGRAGAVAAVADLLGRYRLVTVTGPGGVGKTRLASEVARQVADRFADGAWLTELARVPDPALVPATVAVSLGVRQRPVWAWWNRCRRCCPEGSSCWSWTTVSTCSRPRRSYVLRCCRSPMTCGSSPRAGSPSGSPARHGTGSRR